MCSFLLHRPFLKMLLSQKRRRCVCLLTLLPLFFPPLQKTRGPCTGEYRANLLTIFRFLFSTVCNDSMDR